MHSLYENPSICVRIYAIFCMCVILQEKDSPPPPPPPQVLWEFNIGEVISSWENKGNAFTRKLTFRLYVILIPRVHHSQGKVVLFSGKQMISSAPSSLLLLIKNLLRASARHHLSSLCLLIYQILIAALWSRLVRYTTVSICQSENWDTVRSHKWWSQDANCCIQLISYPNSSRSQGAIQELSWVSRPFQGIHKVKTIFMIILKHYLPFLLSTSHEYSVAFSRDSTMCASKTDWIQKQIWESSCLLWSQTLKRFTNMKSNAILLTQFFVLQNILFINYIINVNIYFCFW